MEHLPDYCRSQQHGPFFWYELGAMEWSVMLELLEHGNLYWSRWDSPDELIDASVVVGRKEASESDARFDLQDNVQKSGAVHVERDDQGVVALCPGVSLWVLREMGLVSIFPVYYAQGTWNSLLTQFGFDLCCGSTDTDA